MAEIVIKIPDELSYMKDTSDMEWTLLVNKILQERLDRIARLQKIVSKSKLTEKGVDELTDKINTSLAKRYLG